MGVLSSVASGDERLPFPPVVSSQPAGEDPPSPDAAVAVMGVPEGFAVNLFAAEPDVQQPISMMVDARGRVWVAECYTYGGRAFDSTLRDRIVVLEDTDGDGRADRRTVFWDQGNRTTSVLPAVGGAYILNAGCLSFLADTDGDLQADGAPRVLLDGFDKDSIGHNIASGLMWGPDGWIYGRHGIQQTSRPAPPEVPLESRPQINASIWRVHPARPWSFEAVTHGTTNPWGLDYDRQGELFFTNNVIGHGWHVIHGAHYKRMYGADFNPYVFDLIDQHADHYHWDNSQTWTASRDAVGVHGELGGGHSHCGGLIYCGENWPDEYRGSLFMCNTHGRRVNRDRIVPAGSGYVLEHAPDVLHANQPWFRGVSLGELPDGTVLISDWVDNGECHDNDGVHRLSGRIYRVRYTGRPAATCLTGEPLDQQSDAALVGHQAQPNEWLARHSRGILLQRASISGRPLSDEANVALDALIDSDAATVVRLRAMWCRFANAGVSSRLLELMADRDSLVRTWAIRLAVHHHPFDRAVRVDSSWPRLKAYGPLLGALQRAAADPSLRVRLEVCSALQRLPVDDRLVIGGVLASSSQNAADHNLPLMIWYAIEPAVVFDAENWLAVAATCPTPLISQFIVRRLTMEGSQSPDVLQQVVAAIHRAEQEPGFAAMLSGLRDGLRGRRKLQAPAAWTDAWSATLVGHPDLAIRNVAMEIGVIFGDGQSMEALVSIARDKGAASADRSEAVASLAANRDPRHIKLLLDLLTDPATENAAARGLAEFDTEAVADSLLAKYGRFKAGGREAAIDTLCSRPGWALRLLSAMDEGAIPAAHLGAAQAQRLAAFGDAAVLDKLSLVWGQFAPSSAEKEQAIQNVLADFTPAARAQADLANGRVLFNQHCGACHQLFGEGKAIGPNLTGANRDNLLYLAENILDPSRMVPNQFRTSVIVLESGQTLVGVVIGDTDGVVTIQTDREQVLVPRAEVVERQATGKSLMPEGLLDKLSAEQKRDLLGYLMQK